MEKQILEASFLFSEDKNPNVNYSKIINMDICPAPFENNSYQQQMSGKSGDLPDRGNYFLRKRRGLEKCVFMRQGNVENMSDWEVVDSVFVDGSRFLLVKSKDRTKLRIYKQQGVIDRDRCADEEDTPYQEGWFENITYYQYLVPGSGVVVRDYFPCVPCLSDKFAIGYGPKNVVMTQQLSPGQTPEAWKEQPSKTLPLTIKRGRIINSIVGNEVLTYFVDEDNLIIEGNPGDYVYIFDGPYASQHLGIASIETSVWDGRQGFLMEGPFAGFSFVSKNPTQTTVLADGTIERVYDGDGINGEFNRSEVCSYLVFKDRGDILYFATANGIYSLNNHGLGWKDSCFVYEGNTHYDTMDNLAKPLYIISSLVSNNDSMLFIDQKRGLLYHGLYGYQNTYFDPRNVLSVGGKYTDIVILSGYPILLGRESVALIRPQLIAPGSISFSNFLIIASDVGYWNKGSYHSNGGVLSWFGSDKLYRKTIVQTYGNDIAVPQTQIENTNYGALVSSLFRGRDEVFIGFDGRKEYFIIATKKGPFLERQTTIVLVKDFFWHQWIYQEFYLRGFDRLGAYGYGCYGYGGSRDDGQEIRTLVQMNFGEYNVFLPKEVIMAKYIIGYNSTITFGNTIVRFWGDYGGYRYKGTYGELYRREYITNLMKAKSNQLIDNGVLKEFGYGGNVIIGFGQRGISRTFKTPEREGFNFQYDLFEWDKETLTTVSYELSKYGIIEEPINLPCNNFTIEIATKGDDEVEFGGFMIVYAQRDVLETRIEDVGVVGETLFSKNPLTI